MNDFSSINLKYMRKFTESCSDKELVQRTVALITWRSNIILFEKLSEIEHSFGKDMLVFQIEITGKINKYILKEQS